jgi:hypothetical protein
MCVPIMAAHVRWVWSGEALLRTMRPNEEEEEDAPNAAHGERDALRALEHRYVPVHLQRRTAIDTHRAHTTQPVSRAWSLTPVARSSCSSAQPQVHQASTRLIRRARASSGQHAPHQRSRDACTHASDGGARACSGARTILTSLRYGMAACARVPHRKASAGTCSTQSTVHACTSASVHCTLWSVRALCEPLGGHID